jgi:hypothetical protein
VELVRREFSVEVETVNISVTGVVALRTRHWAVDVGSEPR